jgi:ABC-type transport system involved in multi-copper enzyme maturation permease subunit
MQWGRRNAGCYSGDLECRRGIGFGSAPAAHAGGFSLRERKGGRMKKILVIAWQTVRSYVRDRVLHSVLLFSVLFVAFSFFLSTLTIVETRKILLDFGLSAISIMGVMLSLFLGVTVVGKELERRTIYTVLAKPVRRSEYVMGKFLGAACLILVVHILNGFTLWAMLQQLDSGIPAGFLSANYLMLLESILVLGLALFLSLALSSLFLASCLALAFFLIGRSNYSLGLLAGKMGSMPAKWALRAIHDVFPSLDRFDIRELVAYGKAYPEGMVALSSMYFVVYVILLLGASVIIIQRKDLP